MMRADVRIASRHPARHGSAAEASEQYARRASRTHHLGADHAAPSNGTADAGLRPHSCPLARRGRARKASERPVMDAIVRRGLTPDQPQIGPR